MPNIQVAIPHQLTRTEAKERVANLTGQIQDMGGGLLKRVEERWDGDVLRFSYSAAGAMVSGHATLEDQWLRLEIAVPWAFALLAGTFKARIEQEGRKLLEKKT